MGRRRLRLLPKRSMAQMALRLVNKLKLPLTGTRNKASMTCQFAWPRHTCHCQLILKRKVLLKGLQFQSGMSEHQLELDSCFHWWEQCLPCQDCQLDHASMTLI